MDASDRIRELEEKNAILTRAVADLSHLLGAVSFAYQRQLREGAISKKGGGLPNSEAFKLLARQLVARSRRLAFPGPSSPVSFMFLDLDNFKVVNDSMGHDIGDLAIREVANVIGTVTREDEVAGHSSGDEFIVAIMGGQEEAAGYCRRLYEALGERKSTSRRKFWQLVDVSVGVATFSEGETAKVGYYDVNTGKVVGVEESMIASPRIRLAEKLIHLADNVGLKAAKSARGRRSGSNGDGR